MEIKKLKGSELIVGNVYSILGASCYVAHMNALEGERFDIVEGNLKTQDGNQHTLTFELKDGSEKIATLSKKQYCEGSNIVVH
jgi:uncharacterized protein YxjI